MQGLEKVLELQVHYNKLEAAEKELHKLENDQEVPKLERTCISDRNNLEKVLLTYRENEREIKDFTRDLEDYGIKLNKTETTLYKGEIVDLKQLEHLNKEKTYLMELIDTLENKIIGFLEKNDKLEKSICDWENEIKKKEKMISDLEKANKKSLSNLRKEIEVEKSSIEEYSKEIDPLVLEQFLSIKEKKNDSGIATLVGNVCSECNIMIRPAQVDKIRLAKEVNTCENCGRILFILESKKDYI